MKRDELVEGHFYVMTAGAFEGQIGVTVDTFFAGLLAFRLGDGTELLLLNRELEKLRPATTVEIRQLFDTVDIMDA